MRRKIYQELLNWKKTRANACALLIEGARRVGKSYIVSEFARHEYRHSLILDFATASRAIRRLFEDQLDNLDDFFMQLEARTGVRLVPHETVIVFDEVQRFPRAREALKYLVADGRFHYIETGSLISIKRNIEHIVIPSEEMKVRMFPMDFEEFLWAIDREPTMALIRRRFRDKAPMGQIDHRQTLELYRQYLVVGGMPQAVAAFANGKNLNDAEAAKRLILGLYEDDIGKFAGRLQYKVRDIWHGIPGALAEHERRFKPSIVGEGVRMRDLMTPFEWLEESMTVNVARNVTDPNAGFAMTEERSVLKCYMGDTGLLLSHAFSDNRSSAVEMARMVLIGKLEVNKGMLMENAIAQAFRSAGCRLFFHANSGGENPEERMEIDFLLTKGRVSRRHNVIPVEVKSSKDYRTVSLDRFCRKYASYVARPVILHPGDLRMEGSVSRYPLYMASLLPEMDQR